VRGQFISKLPEQLVIFKRQRLRNKDECALLALQEKHSKSIFKQPFTNFKLLNGGKKCSAKLTVISWLSKKLHNVMFNFHERLFKTQIADLLKICVVTKTLVDKRMFFLAHQILGCLYFNLDLLADARAVFELIKDVAEEARDWGQAMQSYDWIGRVLLKDHDFANAAKAFKKML